ncbi:hypothetical protein [Aurantimonas sp. A3-2-R12]|nr:hypothetical protein [Aurantimonas sp. A3-2-R12]
MSDDSEGRDIEETKRIMERLVNTPPQPKGGKAEKEGEKKPPKEGRLSPR